MSNTETTLTPLALAQEALHAIDPDGFERDAAHDIIAEITGEAAAFGDSAPGSAAQLRAAREFLAEVRVLEEAVAALTPAPVVDWGDNEPF